MRYNDAFIRYCDVFELFLLCTKYYIQSLSKPHDFYSFLKTLWYGLRLHDCNYTTSYHGRKKYVHDLIELK